MKTVENRRREKDRPTLREQHARLTRSRIISAAQELFLERGYVVTTIEAVAGVAGVAVSTVYFVFGSKLGILRAIRERWHEGSRIEEVLDQAAGKEGAEERLELLARGTRGQWENSPAMMGIYRQAAGADPEAAKDLGNELAGRRVWLDRLVRGMEQLLRHDVAVGDAAAILRALCRYEVFEELVVQSGWSGQKYESWLARTLREHLLPRPGAPPRGTEDEREQLRRTVALWRSAGPELERIRLRELSRLTPEAQKRAINDLLDLGYRLRRTRVSSGLVEQQALFGKLRP
jgi:AcrR family transcriptional regulator